MPSVTTPSRMWVAGADSWAAYTPTSTYTTLCLFNTSAIRRGSNSASALTIGRAIAVRPRSRPGPYDALRAAPGSAALRYARSSTFRENILDEHEHRRRPADVAAAYSEANEQTLDAWRAETDQWESIDTDRGATE
jgi:hypothetical protein